jgi:hypothetical protein
MKAQKEILDVDFIGGQETSLTNEEEAALHDFFAEKKLASISIVDKRRSTTKRLKTTA